MLRVAALRALPRWRARGDGQGAKAGSGKQHPTRGVAATPLTCQMTRATNRLPTSAPRHLQPDIKPCHHGRVIITHAQNPQGLRRIYLGGKSSLECWIEPDTAGHGWSFKAEEAHTGLPLSDADRRACMVHLLLELARTLDVSPDDLAATPYEAIAACHTANPLDSRRVPMPRSKTAEHGFMATAPNIRRPATDFRTPDSEFNHRRR